MQILAIACGGALGALARYGVSHAITLWLGRGFPYGTLTVNVVGSLLLGFVSVILLERATLAPEWRGFLVVGLFGAFTTFSTFSLDTLHLLQQAAYLKALVNVLGNVLLCLVAAYIGILLAKALPIA